MRLTLARSRRQARNCSRVQGASMSSESSARRRKSGVLGGMEEHGLRRDSGAKRHGTALLPCLCVLQHLLQDKHHGSGGHVAVTREDVARVAERIARQTKALLHGIEDGTAYRVHGPEIDGLRIFSARDLRARILQGATNLGGNLAGELHVESHLANAPRNEMACVGKLDGKKTVDAQPLRLRADQARGATIRKEQEREHL